MLNMITINQNRQHYCHTNVCVIFDWLYDIYKNRQKAMRQSAYICYSIDWYCLGASNVHIVYFKFQRSSMFVWFVFIKTKSVWLVFFSTRKMCASLVCGNVIMNFETAQWLALKRDYIAINMCFFFWLGKLCENV